MASADVAWKEPSGALREIAARMEDTSRSGACIRMPAPAPVGMEMSIKWHKERFSGVTKYCRKDGLGYLLGIHRTGATNIERNVHTLDMTENSTSSPAAQPPTTIPDMPVRPNESAAADAATSPAAKARAGKFAPPDMASEALTASAVKVPAHTLSSVPVIRSSNAAIRPGNQIRELKERSPRKTESLQAAEAAAETMPSHAPERTGMLQKWIQRASSRHQQVEGNSNTNGHERRAANTHQDSPPATIAGASTNVPGVAALQGELLSLEDIYRAAGIMSLRLGYSINTVVEMLNSDHMRGMSNDVKRAAVLMALETAGIPVEQVLRDAAQRMEAINAYEDGQRRHIEEYEARKNQENEQIQAEIERITAHLVDRIKQNAAGVELAKDVFRNWQAAKHDETRDISEAAGLCEREFAPETPAESLVALQATGFITKP